MSCFPNRWAHFCVTDWNNCLSNELETELDPAADGGSQRLR
jgi:hypothetical protein